MTMPFEFDGPIDQFPQLTNERYAPYGCMYDTNNGALLNNYNPDVAAACETSRPKYSSPDTCPFGCPVDAIQDAENTEDTETGTETMDEMVGSGEESTGAVETSPNTSMNDEGTSRGELGAHSAISPLSLLVCCFIISII